MPINHSQSCHEHEGALHESLWLHGDERARAFSPWTSPALYESPFIIPPPAFNSHDSQGFSSSAASSSTLPHVTGHKEPHKAPWSGGDAFRGSEAGGNHRLSSPSLSSMTWLMSLETVINSICIINYPSIYFWYPLCTVAGWFLSQHALGERLQLQRVVVSLEHDCKGSNASGKTFFFLPRHFVMRSWNPVWSFTNLQNHRLGNNAFSYDLISLEFTNEVQDLMTKLTLLMGFLFHGVEMR